MTTSLLKGNRNGDTKWPENVQNVLSRSSAHFVSLFYQYFYRRCTCFFLLQIWASEDAVMFVGSLPMKNRKTLAHGVFGIFATYAGLVYEITIATYAGLVYEITIQCHICRPCLWNNYCHVCRPCLWNNSSMPHMPALFMKSLLPRMPALFMKSLLPRMSPLFMNWITIATYDGLVYEITIAAYACLVYKITISTCLCPPFLWNHYCHVCRPCLWNHYRLLGAKWQYSRSCFSDFQTSISIELKRMRNRVKNCCVEDRARDASPLRFGSTSRTILAEWSRTRSSY